jgi:hypothetical protein
MPNIRIKPNCKICNLPYLGEGNGLGVCLPCHRNDPAYKRKQLNCQCGNKALIILETRVGEDGAYKVELPLCHDCFQEELNYKLGI